MADLLRALKAIDARADWRFGRASKSEHPALPFIALMRYGHFVVVDAMNENTVLVRDPAVGRVRYQPVGFAFMWSGYFLAPQAGVSDSGIRKHSKRLSFERMNYRRDFSYITEER